MNWFESQLTWSLIRTAMYLPVWLLAAALLPLLTLGKLKCATPWRLSEDQPARMYWRHGRQLVIHPKLALLVVIVGYFTFLLFRFS